MAKEVVDNYLNSDVPLDDSLAKTAVEEDLNPDQIQNLVQLANSVAHLTLFDNKDDGDKIVEFSPADPDDVLKRVYKGSIPDSGDDVEDAPPPSASDKAMDFFGDFPDLSKKLREIVGGGEPAGEESSPASPGRKSMVIIKIRKVAADLKDRELQAAVEYKEELDKLASEFAKLYGPSHSEFEKDALAVRGDAALSVLCDVRECLRMPPIKSAILEKTARVVDTDTPLLTSLDTLIKLSAKHTESRAAYDYLKEKVGGAL